MEEDTDAAPPDEEMEVSEAGTEAEKPAGEITLKETDLPNKGAQDPAEPSEATQDGERPEEAVPEMEPSTSVGLPETSQEATEVDLSTKVSICSKGFLT